MAGNLYLVPNLLGAVAPERVLPSHTLAVSRSLTHWIVETPKPARAFLKTLGANRPIASLAIEPIPEQVDAGTVARLLAPAHAGLDLGLLSDAGCPGVADPGTALVAAAHDRGLATRGSRALRQAPGDVRAAGGFGGSACATRAVNARQNAGRFSR